MLKLILRALVFRLFIRAEVRAAEYREAREWNVTMQRVLNGRAARLARLYTKLA